jgi:hypothetical protein
MLRIGDRVIPNAISRGRGAYTRPVDYGKSNIIYKYGQQSSSFDPTSQTEDIGNNSIAGTYGLKNLHM